MHIHMSIKDKPPQKTLIHLFSATTSNINKTQTNIKYFVEELFKIIIYPCNTSKIHMGINFRF